MSEERNQKPSREEAEAAVRTLIAWAGDDPTREGLIETPKRVVKSYEEFYEGYDKDPKEILSKVFEEIEGYDEIVLVKDIPLQSHCEHHMVPIIGKAHVAYMAGDEIIGLSKINRIVQFFSKRPQVQERLTIQVVEELKKVLNTDDVACVIEAKHLCVSMRGIKDTKSVTVTGKYSGCFNTQAVKQEFLSHINLESNFDR